MWTRQPSGTVVSNTNVSVYGARDFRGLVLDSLLLDGRGWPDVHWTTTLEE